jgi:hypothetical protein
MTSNMFENLINWLQYRKNRREFMGNLSSNLFYLDDLCEMKRVDFSGGISKECFKFYSQFSWNFSENKNPTTFFIKSNKIQSADDTALKTSCSKKNNEKIFLFLSQEFSIELSRPKLEFMRKKSESNLSKFNKNPLWITSRKENRQKIKLFTNIESEK